jgi:hypothetical protein
MFWVCELAMYDMLKYNNLCYLASNERYRQGGSDSVAWESRNCQSQFGDKWDFCILNKEDETLGRNM